MRTFKLVRHKDVSGVSGTGEVAEGVEFHDGQCILSWFGQFHSICVFPKIDDIVAIHGHDGATEVVFEDYERCRWCEQTFSPDDTTQIVHDRCYKDLRHYAIGGIK